MKKIITLMLASTIALANLSGAEIEWSGSPNPIPDDGNIYYINQDIEQTTDVTVDGVLEIRNGTFALASGPDTLNVNGTVYVYDKIMTGTYYTIGQTTYNLFGKLNINHGGSIFLLGGEITYNPNASLASLINIKAGGSLYNYHGTAEQGAAADFTIQPGGKFHNVRGNNPWPFTISAGGAFTDGNEIDLDKDVDINWTWTLTNKATINGYGNEITFGPNGAIVIEKDASLLLEDVLVNDVSGNQIRCTDVNSTLTLNNVVWTQDADYSLTWGKIFFENNVLIRGKNTTLNYESDQILTITHDATLHLKQVTFNYNTAPSSLIDMSQSAILHLDRSTFKASQDCNLANGNLFSTGLATLWGDGATLDISGIGDLDIDGGLERVGTVV